MLDMNNAFEYNFINRRVDNLSVDKKNCEGKACLSGENLSWLS